MDTDDDFDPADQHDDSPRYADFASLESPEILTALQGLTLFRDPYALLTEPRSVYQLSGEARKDWQHSIADMAVLR